MHKPTIYVYARFDMDDSTPIIILRLNIRTQLKKHAGAVSRIFVIARYALKYQAAILRGVQSTAAMQNGNRNIRRVKNYLGRLTHECSKGGTL